MTMHPGTILISNIVIVYLYILCTALADAQADAYKRLQCHVLEFFTF